MDFINKKIGVMVNKLKSLTGIESKKLEFEYIECPEYKKDNTPPEKDAGWKKFSDDYRFSGVDSHYWIHLVIPKTTVPDGCELRLSVKTGREGGWDACNPQFIVYINGKTVQALDVNHTWMAMEKDTEYDVYMYLYTGMEGGNFDVLPRLQIIDLRIEELYHDIRVPYECMELLEKDSIDYIEIRDFFDKALLMLDLRDVYSDEFYESVALTTEYIKKEFYEKLCGKSRIKVSCIGHTHIDVAWLWTVAQTREKAQRSFATVVNLMKRYDDYKFMSSQPQLYKYVKESDPELYEEIKGLIKEGRWEAEGAMWLEPDTNLASGESLIRQLLYGKRFMKEEFGVDNTMLWLPDVFGYSGALPQILKKSGVTKFFTTKMTWNESNKMPNDIFIWEGIDGSQVFSDFSFSYGFNLIPKWVKFAWDDYKNKDITNNTLFTFGHADGGGGPTPEELENYKRLKYGLPGMTKPVIEKTDIFFENVQKDFEKRAETSVDIPTWVGEMYLEMHRGTYTSMAKNKKYNRKSELLYQQAEAISVTNMIENGATYPEETFRKNYETILLNQFHDILPGSSIKQVYDVTDVEYEKVLKDGRELVDNGMDLISSAVKTDGGVFIYNPTPFEISDYIEHDGETYYAENIPAHGWKVIEDKPLDMGISVSDKVLENDVIKVTFNDKYHIVSVFDKEEDREVLECGAEANRLEVFEDYPRDYDAWEITNYYKQKMWIADDVTSVEKLSNGIRIKRKYQKSEITQDILLKKSSKRIDFVTTVDWHEDHVLLKAAFPVDIRSTHATYDIQFGNVERPTHKNTSWDAAKFEVCAHKWADLSDSGYGVSILNDCKYGYSIEKNVMKISLLKAATYPNPDADRGMHQFTYSIYPHVGGYIEGKTVREGYLLNMPLEAKKINKNEGSLSECYSLVTSDKENVIVETIKKAESDDSIVMRMYEAYNRKTKAEIEVGFDFKEVYLCDMMENNIKKLAHDGNLVKVNIKNYEILTLKFVR